jgi:hypothetical protein
LRRIARALGRMQDEAKFLVYEISARDAESLPRTGMEAIPNYDLGVASLVGSMSDLRYDQKVCK